MKLFVPPTPYTDPIEEVRFLMHCQAIALIIAHHKHDNPALGPMSIIDVAIEKYLEITGAKMQ